MHRASPGAARPNPDVCSQGAVRAGSCNARDAALATSRAPEEHRSKVHCTAGLRSFHSFSGVNGPFTCQYIHHELLKSMSDVPGLRGRRPCMAYLPRFFLFGGGGMDFTFLL